ncbi:MAG TPA: sugar phosphate isomerase/epimerase [Fimbriiglobus sp.]|jgi:sugar phosphate isomerase/epimerase
MTNTIHRRAWLAGTAGLATSIAARADDVKPKSAAPFQYSLNTSTVRNDGHRRPIVDLVEIAAKAGYSGVEPWINELEDYVRAGGSLRDLKKRIADAGLVVPSAIGFAAWVADDANVRRKGLEQAKRDMELVAQIGGAKIAAPPWGATDLEGLSLPAAAERYRALFDLGQKMGVTPEAEVWGFSKALKRLGDTWYVAAECGRSGGCVLPDVYHLYKGGSDFAGLKLLSPHAIGIFHVNDYPPNKGRDIIVDADRVYPGDGVAPLKDVFRTLIDIGYKGFLSVELFNRDYWKQDPNLVAKTALDKLKTVVAKAI